MGATQSMNSKLMRFSVQQFQSEQWQTSTSLLKRTPSTAGLHSSPEDHSPILTYSSERYSFRIDEYQLDSDESPDLDQYLREIQWRNRCQYLVNVRFLRGFAGSSICNTNPKSNYLYIEHIPLRLSQITDIPFPENLYLLNACLTGFHYIFLHQPTLDIREEMICITPEGRVKVWMHPNLAKHTPHIHNIFKTARKSEIGLVQDIVNMVNDNTDHQFQPINFRDYLNHENLHNLTFAQALQALHNFATLLHIRIPICLESVSELFTESKAKGFSPVLISSSAVRNNDVNETRMVQSIPLHLQQESQPQYNPFIKHAHTYSISVANSIPFQPTPDPRPNTPINFVYRTVQKTEEASHNDYALSQSLSNERNKTTPGSQTVNNASMMVEQEWKYFNSEGWEDIDPQILMDLKKIAIPS